MSKKNSSWLIGAGIILFLAIVTIVTYNGLVSKDEKVKQQWAEVQNAYQRRLDLIPNVVNVVKGGAEYEQTTLQKVVEARAKATSTVTSNNISPDNYNRQGAVQDELASAANRLLVNVEKYPQLKGTRAFSDLQVQLEGTERRIKVARKDFNGAIATYNSSVKSFPTNIIGGMLGFKSRDGFKSDTGADKAVEIKF